MAVDRDQLRRMLVELSVEREVVGDVVGRRRVLQVAHVLAEDRLTVLDQAEGVLELAAEGQNLPVFGETHGQRNRRRRIAPRPAQQARPAQVDAQDRIVDPAGDFPIVHQGEVGDLGQLCAGLVVGDALRPARDVAAGHDHRPGQAAQHQVMQRRVGQHEAQPVEAGGHGLGQGLALRLQEDDRRGRAAQQRLFFLGDRAETPDHLDVPCHQREGLAAPALAGAQEGHHLGHGRVAGQVKAADALDRDDVAPHQQGAGRIDVVVSGDGLVARRTAAQVLDPGPRAAGVAGDRLGVEAPVGRVLVLAPAVRAEREVAHRGLAAVVGRGFDDGKARPAVGAVGEGIAVAPGEGIADFGQAVGAGRHVRGHRGPHRAADRGGDLEALRRQIVEGRPVDPVDPRQGGNLRPQAFGEALQLRAPEPDLDPVAGVAHVAGEAQLGRDTPDRRAETDALDLAAHGDGFTLHAADP